MPQHTFSAIGLVRSGWLAAILGIWLLAFVLRNRLSFIEGLRYLQDLRQWNPNHGSRLHPDGLFASCYDLVVLNNRTRYAFLLAEIAQLDLPVREIPVPGEPLPNLFVPFGLDAPCTLLVAHYDKSREDLAYQGASDNTASVAVLLAALREFAQNPPQQPIGVLFSAAEERGLLGARAFLEYSRVQGIQITAVLNFDMLGRDNLAIRPSARPGFYFAMPGFGMVAYDGRQFRRAEAFSQPDALLVKQLCTMMAADLVVYRRFTARSDSNVFHEAGIPTVSISSSNMYYLDAVWERDSDRVELLDQRNLDLAYRLIEQVATMPHAKP